MRSAPPVAIVGTGTSILGRDLVAGATELARVAGCAALDDAGD